MALHTEIIGCKEYQLSKLTPRDFMTISGAVFARKRKKLLDDLQDAGVDGPARLQALSALREDEDHVRVMMRHCATLEGAREIVQLSLSRNGKENADELEITPDALVRLSAQLCHFRLLSIEEIKQQEDENMGFPMKPAAAGGT